MKLWRILRLAAWACWIAIAVVAVINPNNAALAAFFLVAFFPLMIASIIAKSKDPHVKRAKEARRHNEKQKRYLDSTPVAAELVSIQEKIRGGTAVGALTGGILGAALCAHLSKERATFLVRYASGRTSVETVVVKSARFKELSALCEK